MRHEGPAPQLDTRGEELIAATVRKIKLGIGSAKGSVLWYPGLRAQVPAVEYNNPVAFLSKNHKPVNSLA